MLCTLRALLHVTCTLLRSVLRNKPCEGGLVLTFSTLVREGVLDFTKLRSLRRGVSPTFTRICNVSTRVLCILRCLQPEG